jgi:hypothetical protein
VSLLGDGSGVRRDTVRKGYPFRQAIPSSVLDFQLSCATSLTMAAMPSSFEPTVPCLSASGLA